MSDKVAEIPQDNTTPGPWYAVEYSGFWEIQAEKFYDADDNLLNEETCPEAEANAKLMASAPQLKQEIERLKGLIEKAHERGWGDCWDRKPYSQPLSWQQFKKKNNL